MNKRLMMGAGMGVMLVAGVAMAQAPSPGPAVPPPPAPEMAPPPGGPMGGHPPMGPMMHRMMERMHGSKAAHFRFRKGDAMVDIKCAEDEPTKACVDAGSALLDKLQPK